MIFFMTIDKNALINSFMNQMPLGFIVYKVISKFWTSCLVFMGKWIVISKALLLVKCEK